MYQQISVYSPFNVKTAVDSNGDTVDLNYILQKFTLEAAGLMFISTKFGVFQGKSILSNII